MRIFQLLAVGLLGAGCAQSVPGRAVPVSRGPAVFPTVAWEPLADAEAARWSAAGLDSVRAAVSRMKTTALMVIQGGQVVMSYGDLTRQSYIASVRKSVLSMLYGIDLARGRIDTSKTLAALGIDDLGGLLPVEREATVQDLLSARSGVFHQASYAGDDLDQAPPRGSVRHGTFFLYSNWDFNALGTIYERQTGRNIYDAVETELARPLGMQDWRRDLQHKDGDSTRSVHLAYPMWFSTRDMARLGYLMLRGGNWAGTQIVPADWARASTRPVTPVAKLFPSADRRGRDRTLQGKTLYDWAVLRGLPPTPETGVQLVLEGVQRGEAGMVYHVIDEADVRRIMAHSQTMIASDGALTKFGEGVVHPRNYGTFPRVLGRYVREEHLLSLEQAINKMTGMPAARLGLADRGCVRAGCVADLTLFDAERVSDVGTFTDPHHYPVGIAWVFINGEAVVANGVMTAARPGRVVRKPR